MHVEEGSGVPASLVSRRGRVSLATGDEESRRGQDVRCPSPSSPDVKEGSGVLGVNCNPTFFEEAALIAQLIGN